MNKTLLVRRLQYINTRQSVRHPQTPHASPSAMASLACAFLAAPAAAAPPWPRPAPLPMILAWSSFVSTLEPSSSVFLEELLLNAPATAPKILRFRPACSTSEILRRRSSWTVEGQVRRPDVSDADTEPKSVYKKYKQYIHFHSRLRSSPSPLIYTVAHSSRPAVAASLRLMMMT